jgi:transcriptional regulator with GAF, ATPase, and Fis domain
VSLPGDRRLAETFVEFADTLVADYDLVDFLHRLVQRSVTVLGGSAAGLMLADPRGRLQVVAASTEQARLLELFELQNDEGPCLDCFRTGEQVSSPDLATSGPRWPRFAAAAGRAGFTAVYALPMRLRREIIGAMNLFRAEPGPLDESTARVGQALVDVATIGILQERAIRRHETVAEQLQTALNSRIVIEQAKGVLSERLGVDMDQAFAALRGYARNHNRRLGDIARAVTEGLPDVAELIGPTAMRANPDG